MINSGQLFPTSKVSYLLFHMDKCVVTKSESTLVDQQKFYTSQSESFYHCCFYVIAYNNLLLNSCIGRYTGINKK